MVSVTCVAQVVWRVMKGTMTSSHALSGSSTDSVTLWPSRARPPPSRARSWTLSRPGSVWRWLWSCLQRQTISSCLCSQVSVDRHPRMQACKPRMRATCNPKMHASAFRAACKRVSLAVGSEQYACMVKHRLSACALVWMCACVQRRAPWPFFKPSVTAYRSVQRAS